MKKIKTGNIYDSLPNAKREEVFETIFIKKGIKVERIISQGQSTPKGEWLEGKNDEWLVLLRGRAILCFEGAKKALPMEPGDYVFIPSGKVHRVEWTATEGESIWLAVHF